MRVWILVLVAALAWDAGASEFQLVGTLWQWSETRGDEPVRVGASDRYTLALFRDGSYAVRADCNRGSGTWEANDLWLSLSGGPTTTAECGPDSLSARYLLQLDSVTGFAREGDRLLLERAAEAGAMVFEPGAAPAEAATASSRVTGTVTYRVRRALPPDARVDLRIEDVSRADAPATLVAERRILSAGRQVPLPFEVPFETAAIDPRGSYTLRAVISDSRGRVLFRTTRAYPVITRDAPSSGMELMLEPAGASNASN